MEYIILASVMLLVLWSLIRGAPYVPTETSAVQKIADALEAGEGKVLADIGSGDGRIVIEFARRGAVAHGYEFNPLLVIVSRHTIARYGLSDRAQIHWGNFWNADLSRYDGISVFGIKHIMSELERKLLAELRPGARAASHVFRFPTWQHVDKSDDGVYVYVKS